MTNIADLNLSNRAYKCLRSAGINTIEKLYSTPDEDLLMLRNFGVRCLAEIHEKLEAYDRRPTYVDLRHEISRLRDMIARSDAAVDEYRDENAELRDLVRMLFDCATGEHDCERCKRDNDGYACRYIMDDLGIGVSGNERVQN